MAGFVSGRVNQAAFSGAEVKCPCPLPWSSWHWAVEKMRSGKRVMVSGSCHACGLDVTENGFRVKFFWFATFFKAFLLGMQHLACSCC